MRARERKAIARFVTRLIMLPITFLINLIVHAFQERATSKVLQMEEKKKS